MEKLNNISINQEFLKTYVSNASQSQLEELDLLFKKEEYDLISKIVEDYKDRLINNIDYKNESDMNVSSSGMTLGIALYNEYLKSLKDKDYKYSLPKILSLIDKYEAEKNIVNVEETNTIKFNR